MWEFVVVGTGARQKEGVGSLVSCHVLCKANIGNLRIVVGSKTGIVDVNRHNRFTIHAFGLELRRFVRNDGGRFITFHGAGLIAVMSCDPLHRAVVGPLLRHAEKHVVAIGGIDRDWEVLVLRGTKSLDLTNPAVANCRRG